MTYIPDTHALVWFLSGDAQLSFTAAQALSDPSANIVIPTIVLAEIHFLYTRMRIQTDVKRVLQFIANTPNATTYPLDEVVVEKLPVQLRIHDAIIVATGMVFRDVLGEPTVVITQDSRIVSLGLIQTLW
ncbi:MAG: PIN domain-containing protein [Fimbriimonadales bacterium]|nr:PIN domain-containing protein [Fimbriimonadales bacterium]